jgi:hypothetical protein
MEIEKQKGKGTKRSWNCTLGRAKRKAKRRKMLTRGHGIASLLHSREVDQDQGGTEKML